MTNLLWIHGWGQSAKIWGDFPHKIADCQHRFPSFAKVNQLQEFVPVIEEYLGGSTTILIGWSMGGMLALEAGIRNSKQVQGIIGINTTLRFVCEDPTLGWPTKILARMQKNLGQNPGHTLKKFSQSMLKGSQLRGDEKLRIWNQMVRSDPMDACEFSIEGLNAGLDYLMQKDLTNSVAKLAIPSLFIHGEKDTICPILSFRKFEKDFEQKKILQFKTLPQPGHLPFLTHPQKLASAINEFVHEVNNR